MKLKSEINYITSKIVASHFPHEVSTYTILSDRIIENALSGKFSESNKDKGDFKFIDEANIVVGFASVIISLVSMYSSYKKKKKKPELKNIMSEWKSLLIENGLSEEEADTIVWEYSDLVVEKLLDRIKDNG